jgi:hypothetical protein
VLFHVIGLKCQMCGSYNTCRTEDPDSSASNKASQPNTTGSEPTGAAGDGQPTTTTTGASNTTHVPSEGTDKKK